MRTTITLCLLILLVSAQTPAGQLFKLPVLIEHFVKHQKQDGVSLLEFLADHYLSDHDDADLPEDEQLPFKSITFSSLGYAIIPGEFRSNEMVSQPDNNKVIYKDEYLPQQHLVRIFHPPRV